MYPLPVADALAALEAADSLHERRDRVVEAFRAAIRYLAAVALAVRVQYGAGPGDEPAQLKDMLRSLRRRGLTDGQWVGLIRGMLSSWSAQPDAYPLPGLAALFAGKSKKKLAKVIDGLLEMRKAETVAHGATGSADAIAQVLARREPQLQELLKTLAPLFEAKLVVPIDDGHAYLLEGYSPGNGRWKRCALDGAAPLEPGHPVLIADGKPVVSLHPIALFLEPSPDADKELFVLDGAKRKAALYVAFPSMAEHRAVDVWGCSATACSGGRARTSRRLRRRGSRGLTAGSRRSVPSTRTCFSGARRRPKRLRIGSGATRC